MTLNFISSMPNVLITIAMRRTHDDIATYKGVFAFM
jgi:hypothetical protein